MRPFGFGLVPVVAVPARNEEHRLPLLLSALNRQNWCIDHGPLVVVAVLNNCEDQTRQAVLRGEPDWANLRIDCIDVHFPPETAHVGSARRLAMDRALACLPDISKGVILTTDADAVPEPGWIETNLRALSKGADLVGGRLYGNREEEARFGPSFAARAGAALTYSGLCDRLASLIDPLDLDPWPRHADHTGGSLAIRADIYRALGGLPVLPFREDLVLISMARAHGTKLVHPLDVRVEVSARLAGRAPGGMADCLKTWIRDEVEGKGLLVEDPEQVAARYTKRRAIRHLDRLAPVERMAAAQSLGIDASCLIGPNRCPVSVETLIERFAADDPEAAASVPATEAISCLRKMVAERDDVHRAA